MRVAGVAVALCGALLVSGMPTPGGAWADERRTVLEREISETRVRRQELLEQLLELGSQLPSDAKGDGSDSDIAAGRIEVHRAATAPPLGRQAPDAFDHGLAAGPWPWSEELILVELTLDLNEDGRPEEIRYLQPESGVLLRRHLDRNLDGTIDSWLSYRDGELVRRDLDAGHDGTVDVHEHYVGGRMTQRDVDRDRDGTVDARYLYQDDWLFEARFDPDNDGVVDVRVRYDHGQIVERHHDVDADGQVDVMSFYVDGKLLRREILSLDADALAIDALAGP